MSVSVDSSQVLALSGAIRKNAGAVGARTAAAIRKTAHDIEADAKGFAPVDTGFLRNSISTTISGDGRFGEIAAVIGPTAEYGIYQEVGTSKMPAHPYLAPAFDRRIGGFTAALGKLGGIL